MTALNSIKWHGEIWIKLIGKHLYAFHLGEHTLGSTLQFWLSSQHKYAPIVQYDPSDMIFILPFRMFSIPRGENNQKIEAQAGNDSLFQRNLYFEFTGSEHSGDSSYLFSLQKQGCGKVCNMKLCPTQCEWMIEARGGSDHLNGFNIILGSIS